MPTRPLHLALSADLDGSRAIPAEQREAVQQHLQAVLARLNRLHAGHLEADLDLGAGDQIQGLVRATPHGVVTLAGLALGLAMRAAAFDPWPLRFGFGIGVGEVTTSIPRDAIRRVDGPCFHRAGDALSHAKSAKQFLAVRGFGEPDDRVLGGLFAALGALIDEWTARQAEFAVATVPDGLFVLADRSDAVSLPRPADRLRMAEERTRTEVAERFDVSVPTVSKSLGAARWGAFHEAAYAATWAWMRLGSQAADPS